MSKRWVSVWALAVLLAAVFDAAGEPAVESGFTPSLHAEGWTWRGDVASYNRVSVFDLINGEAELYFPYGFKRVFLVTYVSDTNAEEWIDAQVYEMGSLLDAFGIYSYYRDQDDDVVAVGAEGVVGSTQAMFYQEQYFVRLGFNTPRRNKPGLLAVARALSEVLPESKNPPPELGLLQVEGIRPKTARYVAKDVLGYRFFARGLMAQAQVGDQPLRIFVVFSATPARARQALLKYLDHLEENEAKYRWVEGPFGKALETKDPLHKDVLMLQVGPYLAGVAGEFGPQARGLPLLERLVHRLRLELQQRKEQMPETKQPEEFSPRHDTAPQVLDEEAESTPTSRPGPSLGE